MPKAAKKGLEKQAGNPAEDITAVIDEFAPRAQARSVELELSGEGNALQVLRDPLTFRQTLRNLIDNAIKYSPVGAKVRIAIDSEGGQARIRIEDAGPGVPAAERDRIFDKFFRGQTGSSDALGGTGLGLFFASETMRAHGGSIQLEERDLPGSTFTLTLPLAREGTPREGS